MKWTAVLDGQEWKFAVAAHKDNFGRYLALGELISKAEEHFENAAILRETYGYWKGDEDARTITYVPAMLRDEYWFDGKAHKFRKTK